RLREQALLARRARGPRSGTTAPRANAEGDPEDGRRSRRADRRSAAPAGASRRGADQAHAHGVVDLADAGRTRREPGEPSTDLRRSLGAIIRQPAALFARLRDASAPKGRARPGAPARDHHRAGLRLPLWA